MGIDQVVLIGRMMLEEVMTLVAPVLVVAIIVSLVVNIFQVLTSLQDSTISTVLRLIATGAVIFCTMPWMWRHLVNYTLLTLSDFHRYLE